MIGTRTITAAGLRIAPPPAGWIDACTVQRLRARRVVVAPFVGEFGWELMNWQARVRQLLREGEYEEACIVTDEPRRALYADLPAEHWRLPAVRLPGSASDDGRIDEHGSPLPPHSLRGVIWTHLRSALAARGWCDASDDAPPTDLAVLTPGMRGRNLPTTPPTQAFVSLRRIGPHAASPIDVVLVPRSRSLAAERNQPAAWWNALAERLTSLGLSVAIYPPDLEAAIGLLSQARLAAGGSTGGLHLASLCECPHLVWGCGDEERWTALGMSNRQRYETFWNPLGTPAIYEPLGWRPSLAAAESAIAFALDEMGRGTEGGERFRRAWKRRRALLDWSHSAAARLLPWRMRSWLKERV